jgi:hypothetical protein
VRGGPTALGAVAGALMTETHGHYLRTWRSRHDNGWEAWVGENEHGDFSVGPARTEPPAVTRDAVEDTETHGKDAALFALERKTGHRCGTGCSGWQQMKRVSE